VKTGKNSYRTYIYAVHVDPETGKRRRCCLGPVEGYKHASGSHADLGGLESAEDRWDRNIYYLSNLIESFTKCDDVEVLMKVIETLNEGVSKISTHLSSLQFRAVNPAEAWRGQGGV